MNLPPDAMTLHDNEDVCVVRHGRHLIAAFKRPHCVLSTCHVNGGARDNITHVVNHQSCEAAGHAERFDYIHKLGLARYHQAVAAELELDPDRSVILGTAADMQYAATAAAAHDEFRVTAVATGGVGNAGRAGDPAVWVERDGAYEHVNAHGTINIQLYFNTDLSPAALARAVVTMTEAKTAVLQDLHVRSRTGCGIATGTGTDQYALACPRPGGTPIHWTGTHTKMGELIARATMESLRQALLWQSGLEPSRTRNMTQILERFGLTLDAFHRRLAEQLSETEHAFFKKNEDAVLHQPQAAACAFALATIHDRREMGALPCPAAAEAMLSQAALMAAALAGRHEAYADLRIRLARQTDAGDTVALVIEALILGIRYKWERPA